MLFLDHFGVINPGSVMNKFITLYSSGYTVGETGRALETRKKEHERNVEQLKSGSNLAKHAWTQGHKINFDECEILDKAAYRHRKTLKSWHTATTFYSDNNAQHLAEQCRNDHSFIFHNNTNFARDYVG